MYYVGRLLQASKIAALWHSYTGILECSSNLQVTLEAWRSNLKWVFRVSSQFSGLRMRVVIVVQRSYSYEGTGVPSQSVILSLEYLSSVASMPLKSCHALQCSR